MTKIFKIEELNEQYITEMGAMIKTRKINNSTDVLSKNIVNNRKLLESMGFVFNKQTSSFDCDGDADFTFGIDYDTYHDIKYNDSEDEKNNENFVKYELARKLLVKNGKFTTTFGVIKGTFNCSCMHLQTLEGCPTSVGGDFICLDNPFVYNDEYFYNLLPDIIGGNLIADDEFDAEYASDYYEHDLDDTKTLYFYVMKYGEDANEVYTKETGLPTPNVMTAIEKLMSEIKIRYNKHNKITPNDFYACLDYLAKKYSNKPQAIWDKFFVEVYKYCNLFEITDKLADEDNPYVDCDNFFSINFPNFEA